MEQGVHLMAVGMGAVFAFLALMVLVMNLAARLFRHLPQDAPPVTASPGTPDDDEREIAVVLAAVEAWRRRGASGGQ